MTDERAKKILFDAYWTSAGWKEKRHVSKADFEYARDAGFMFDNVRLNHDEVVEWLLYAFSKVSKETIVSNFLSSLSTRRLERRSALSSYAVARHFPKHKYQGTEYCVVCERFEHVEIFMCKEDDEFLSHVWSIRFNKF